MHRRLGWHRFHSFLVKVFVSLTFTFRCWIRFESMFSKSAVILFLSSVMYLGSVRCTTLDPIRRSSCAFTRGRLKLKWIENTLFEINSKWTLFGFDSLLNSRNELLKALYLSSLHGTRSQNRLFISMLKTCSPFYSFTSFSLFAMFYYYSNHKTNKFPVIYTYMQMLLGEIVIIHACKGKYITVCKWTVS